jgi:hypothetical protein
MLEQLSLEREQEKKRVAEKEVVKPSKENQSPAAEKGSTAQQLQEIEEKYA